MTPTKSDPGKEVSDADVDDVTAFLVVIAREGVPPDVQERLVQGGALRRAIRELKSRRSPPADSREREEAIEECAEVADEIAKKYPHSAYDIAPAIRALLSSPRDIRGEALEELSAAANNYVRCTQSPSLSPYIKENGRHGSKSPWRELVDAVEAIRSLSNTPRKGEGE